MMSRQKSSEAEQKDMQRAVPNHTASGQKVYSQAVRRAGLPQDDRKTEKNIAWKQLMQDVSGKIRMRKVINKGLSLSSKKRKIKKKVEVKACLEERSIPMMTTGKNTLRLPVKKGEFEDLLY